MDEILSMSFKSNLPLSFLICPFGVISAFFPFLLAKIVPRHSMGDQKISNLSSGLL